MTVGVIGAGAAGIIAGAFAAAGKSDTEILDGNEKVGKKLFLTGKGRCNITNSADINEFIQKIPRNGRFLYSAFQSFFNDDIIRIINSQGVKTKRERGGRFFPESDKSSDVIKALTGYALKCGARLVLNSYVTNIKFENPGFTVSIAGQAPRRYDRLIIAAGGKSYPSTGSTGAGYRFAEELGHSIIPAKPSLIPLAVNENWAGVLEGLSLKNVVLRAYTPSAVENKLKKGKKCRPCYEELGEMLFTRFGISGPLVLSASSFLADDPDGALIEIDLKPALTREALDARVLRDFEKYAHKQIKNAMRELLPQRLIAAVLFLADTDESLSVDNITKEQRLNIVSTLKSLKMTVKCALPIEEAIITRGGVSVKEINPSTMESKLVPGLYFAGEIIDADGCTGGYNLQIAWSTGAAAGMNAAKKQSGRIKGENAMPIINIAIDGPAGAGKSTIAKALSEKLGIAYVDTGAMYRAVGLKAVRLGVDTSDEAGISSFLPHTDISVELIDGAQHIFLDGEDVSLLIRTENISQAASVVSAFPSVRAKLTEFQRRIARAHSVIMDGRDIGTVVLPDSEYKFFVTASPEVRAERRFLEYKASGKLAGRSREDILKEINIRDYRDANREAAPLRPADDAIIIDTSEMNIDEAVEAASEKINLKR